MSITIIFNGATNCTNCADGAKKVPKSTKKCQKLSGGKADTKNQTPKHKRLMQKDFGGL
jgi:hypothetical protein